MSRRVLRVRLRHEVSHTPHTKETSKHVAKRSRYPTKTRVPAESDRSSEAVEETVRERDEHLKNEEADDAVEGEEGQLVGGREGEGGG